MLINLTWTILLVALICAVVVTVTPAPGVDALTIGATELIVTAAWKMNRVIFYNIF